MSDFTFIHMNVRSLTHHSDLGSRIDHIRELLIGPHSCNVFACSETHLDDSVDDSLVSIPAFNQVRKDRNRKGGGLMIYVHETHRFIRRSELEIPGVEVMWIEIQISSKYKILFGACYRPPNQSARESLHFLDLS